MASPFKMSGHTLPGPNQKASPAKCPLIALAIPALVKGAAAAAGGLAVSKGVGALTKGKKNKKEADAKALAKNEEGAASSAASMSGDIGTKSTKLV